jgi:serine/threonine protein kinase
VWDVDYGGHSMVAKFPLETLSDGEVQRMLASATLQQAVQHPNVLRVRHVLRDAPGPCVLLETATHDVSDLFCREGLPASRQMDLALGIAEGVAALHAADPPILHRDLKATNIFVAADSTPKIADFDLAVQAPGEVEGTVGTPGFMAPEVLLGQPYDAKADVFSFASLLYELSHSNAPFWFELEDKYKENARQWGYAVTSLMVEGHRPPLDETKCGPAMQRLIERCWAQCPAERPTMAEVVTDLKAMP